MKIIPRTITMGDLTKKLVLLVLMGFYTYLIYSYFAPPNFFFATTEGLANESDTPSNSSSLDEASSMVGALSTMKSKNTKVTPTPTEEPTTPAPSYDEMMKEVNKPTPDPLCSKKDCDFISEILDRGVNIDPSGVYFKDGKHDCTYAKCEVIRNITKNMTPMDESGKYYLSSGGSVFTSDGKKV
jgi:hypothetical protein